MGFCVWSLLTVSLTWHPGQSKAHRLIVSDADFAAFCHDIAASPQSHEIDAVITGYFAAPGQVQLAGNLIRSLKSRKPDLIYLCDPVMADEGGLYINPAIAHAIRDTLLPLADIIKPNRSELEWICKTTCPTREAMIAAAMQLGAPTLLVSSAPVMGHEATGNLLIEKQGEGNQIWLAEHPLVANPVNGLGDLTASLFLSHLLRKEPAQHALSQTTAAVFDCLTYAVNNKANELLLARSYDAFFAPKSPITLSRLD